MEEQVKIDDFKKAKKKLERKQNFEKTVKTVGTWFENNQELGMIIVPAIVAAGLAGVRGAINITRSAVVTHRENKIEKTKSLRVFDRSAGHYWNLKRALTNDEWQNIERRKASGEKLIDILEELRVLK